MSVKTNEVGFIWDEVLPELIEDIMPGIFAYDSLTPEQWDELSGHLNEHVSTSREFMPPVPSGREVYAINHRGEVAALQERVRKLEAEIGVYSADIKKHFGGEYVYADTRLGHVVIESHR